MTSKSILAPDTCKSLDELIRIFLDNWSKMEERAMSGDDERQDLENELWKMEEIHHSFHAYLAQKMNYRARSKRWGDATHLVREAFLGCLKPRPWYHFPCRRRFSILCFGMFCLKMRRGKPQFERSRREGNCKDWRECQWEGLSDETTPTSLYQWRKVERKEGAQMKGW